MKALRLLASLTSNSNPVKPVPYPPFGGCSEAVRSCKRWHVDTVVGQVVFAYRRSPFPIDKQDVGETLCRGEALHPKHAGLAVFTVGSTRSERRWAKPLGSGSSPVGDCCFWLLGNRRRRRWGEVREALWLSGVWR